MSEMSPHNARKLQSSIAAAHEALQKNAALKVDASGDLKVTGETFFGRSVRYLKTLLIPGEARKQNLAVIAAFNQRIGQTFGENHQLNVDKALENAKSHKHLLQSVINHVSDLRAGNGYAPAPNARGEVNNTLKFGFAGKVIVQRANSAQSSAKSCGEKPPGEKPCGEKPSGETEITKNSNQQLYWYNRTMADLHGRFPKLRNVPPVEVLQLDVRKNMSDKTLAEYNYAEKAMRISRHSTRQMDKVAHSGKGFLTPKQDASGFIHHEYGHHLSMRVVPERVWAPKLVDALRKNGMPRARIEGNWGEIRQFDKDTAGKIAESIGKYSATSVLEFAAEALSWYMNPEYGESVEPMPEHLENWVKDCFPMLRRDQA